MEDKMNESRQESQIEPRRSAILYDLGFVDDYKKVWDFQRTLLSRRIEGRIPDSVIMVEHSHVLTLGRSSHIDNILVKDLPVFEIERGGDVTYHGPGQLVVYPVVSLQDNSLGVKQYVERLESVIVDTLSRFGLDCEGSLGVMTDVWVGESKIASIGVATSHWVTYHGFALNVNTDLSYFEKIRPCGFNSNVMTSMANELGGDSIDLEEVKKTVLSSFSRNFGFDFQMRD